MYQKNKFRAKYHKLVVMVVISIMILGVIAPLEIVHANQAIGSKKAHLNKINNLTDASQATPIDGFGMGSSTHLRVIDVEAAYRELKSMGVKYIREEFPMEYLQSGIGRYNFTVGGIDFDRSVELAVQNGLEFVALLTYGPCDGHAIRPCYATDNEFFSLWEDYVSTLVERYGKDIDYWEIGNEMNSVFFWRKVRPGAAQVEVDIYARMLEITYQVIKKADPNDTVILGGLINETDFTDGYSPLAFMSELKNYSGAVNFDAVGLHTYWGANMPEMLNSEQVLGQRQLFSMIDYVDDFATKISEMYESKIPIWITEVGYDQAWLKALSSTYGFQPEQIQAYALIRIYTALLDNPDIASVFWYTYANDGTGQEFALKPLTKRLLSTLSGVLTGTTPLGQIPIVDSAGQTVANLYEYRYLRSDNQTISIFWKNEPSQAFVSATVNNLVVSPATCYQMDTGLSGAGSIVDEGVTELRIQEIPQILVGSMDDNTRLVVGDTPVKNQATSTASVLLLDTSGSMDEEDITGYTKIEAAQRASTSILDVIQSEKSAFSTYTHQFGMVSFDSSATTHAALSEDLASIKSTVDNLYASGRTGMADGLSAAIDMVAPVDQSYSKMIILLSDGMPNIGLGGDQSLEEDEIISELINLAGAAKANGICIHTIGLGLPDGSSGLEDSMNVDLLQRIASESGCGNYYDANNALELANTFIEIRHSSLGEVLLDKQGEISQDEEVDLGTVAVDQNQEIMLFTLNWPGSQLTLNVSDPTGIVVDDNYPNASWNRTSSLASLVITDPLEGSWGVKIFGAEVPEGLTDYNMLISSRVRAMPIATPEPTPTPTVVPQAREIRSTKGSGFLVLFVSLALGGIGLGVYLTSTRKKTKSKSANQPALIGCSPATQGQRIRLSKGILFGRGSNVNLHLLDPGVSRTHAQVFKSKGEWYIKDLNSQTGTYVNNRAVVTKKLSTGDKIRIGEYSWTFMLGN